MNDVYDSRFAAFIGWMNNARAGYAITIGQTTYYSSPAEVVLADTRWQNHENRHKEQWRKVGFLKFAFLYLWYSAKFGYLNNPFEVDARAHEVEDAPLNKEQA